MTSFRKTALVGGILYLITFLGSIAAAFLVAPGISEVSYLTAQALTGRSLGAVLELVNVFGCIGCGVALFSVIRRVHEGLAIGYVATRLFEAAIITSASSASSPSSRCASRARPRAIGRPSSPVGRGLVAVRYWAMIIGGNMAAFNALMLGTALYRARLVPRAIPALGIVGAPILITFVIGTIIGVTAPGTVFHAIAVMPFFIWELVLGLWLTFKGFNESSPIAIDERARQR